LSDSSFRVKVLKMFNQFGEKIAKLPEDHGDDDEVDSGDPDERPREAVVEESISKQVILQRDVKSIPQKLVKSVGLVVYQRKCNVEATNRKNSNYTQHKNEGAKLEFVNFATFAYIYREISIKLCRSHDVLYLV